MKRTYHNSTIAYTLMNNICLVAVICAIFFGFTCISSALDGANSLNGTYSSQVAEGDADDLTNHAYNQSDSVALDQLNKEKLISGTGYGELLFTFTVNKVLPVFSGRYSYDIAGIHVPPISTPLQVKSSEEAGYSYDLPNAFIPGKPNDFIVSVSGAKTLSIALQKLQGSYGNSSTIPEAEPTRTWVSTQVKADEKGTATTGNDLLSPGIYHAKVFGDAAENVSQVNLTMTVVKKLVVNGPYNLSLNTGFPEGDYSFEIKALNGTFRIDEMLMEI